MGINMTIMKGIIIKSLLIASIETGGRPKLPPASIFSITQYLKIILSSSSKKDRYNLDYLERPHPLMYGES